MRNSTEVVAIRITETSDISGRIVIDREKVSERKSSEESYTRNPVTIVEAVWTMYENAGEY